MTSAAASAAVAGVCAVVVTHRPDLPTLRQVLAAVRPQVGHLLVFDNASGDAQTAALLDQAEADGIVVVRSPTNLGLGAAYNRAARHAVALGASHMLMLDQDSVLEPGAVARLHEALQRLGAAAVGPQFRDARSGRLAPFVQIGFPFNRKRYGGPGQAVEADFLITSGTLVTLARYAASGGLDEALFIDNVDLDWCFRLRRQGGRLYGVCDARMRHAIGEKLVYRGLKASGVILHSPSRLYYIMRNRVALYRRAYTPRVWIAQDVPRLLLRLLGTGMFVAPRLDYLRQMCRGIADGVRGRLGPRSGG
ncbi:MAG: glycosyltransferase family 2 protein [Pseudoxanthomonas sp.]